MRKKNNESQYYVQEVAEKRAQYHIMYKMTGALNKYFFFKKTLWII